MKADRQAIAALSAALDGVPSREEYIRDVANEARRMLASGDPVQIALGGGLLAWLQGGGDLLRRLRLHTPRGSRATPQRIFKRVS